MPLASETVDFLKFLNKNPMIRRQIKAAPGKTLVYAGRWKEARSVQTSQHFWKPIRVLEPRRVGFRPDDSVMDSGPNW
jgi:hypothetical protein